MIKKLLLMLFCLMFFALALTPLIGFASAETILLAKTSKEGLLMSETGEVLFQNNATEKRPIASMTKIMTLICIYDSLNSGKIKLTDTVTVSPNAASMGGSQVFLDANTQHSVENLIKSIIICSANDSCVALAEHISGSVENFVSAMNEKAKQLELVATRFENCTGLPSANQYSCALDVAKMMLVLLEQPHYFACSKIWMEDYVHPDGRVTGMTNTNKLVRFYDGCDGGKTGFTNEALHCLCATAKRGDTRLIAVVIASPDSKTRFAEVSEMLNFGFANYESKILLDKSSSLEKIDVVGGKSKSVEVAPISKLVAFGKKGEINCEVIFEYEKEVKAPVKSGDVLGKAYLVDKNGTKIGETQLVSTQDIDQMSFWDYLNEMLTIKFKNQIYPF